MLVPADRDGDENDRIELLLRHEVGPDQGPDVALVAAGAEQRIDRLEAAATEIIEHAFAADETFLDLVRRLRLAEHQRDHGARADLRGRGPDDVQTARPAGPAAAGCAR